MITFSFGKNWLRYVNYIVTETIIENSKVSLVRFFGEDFTFHNKTFIDVGCGSGIFSLCAAMLGCKHIVSLDVDSKSIEATRMIQKKFAHLIPKDVLWEVEEASILDNTTVEKWKEKADILYSWGVLHHTGNLNVAMLNASRMVKPDGLAYIALYNQTEASAWWLKVKSFYNQTNVLMKFLLVIGYTLFLTMEDLRKGRGLNFYDKTRGMYKITDVIDWLGGLPYEPINVEQTLRAWKTYGFEAVKVAPTKYNDAIYPKSLIKKWFVYLKCVGLGCNEFLVHKRAAECVA